MAGCGWISDSRRTNTNHSLKQYNILPEGTKYPYSSTKHTQPQSIKKIETVTTYKHVPCPKDYKHLPDQKTPRHVREAKDPRWEGGARSKQEVLGSEYHQRVINQELAEAHKQSKKYWIQAKGSLRQCNGLTDGSTVRPPVLKSRRTSEDPLESNIATCLKKVINLNKGILTQITRYGKKYLSYSVVGVRPVGKDNTKALEDHIKEAFLNPIYKRSQELHYYRKADDPRRQPLYEPNATIKIETLLDEVKSLGDLLMQLPPESLNKLRSESTETGLESSRTPRPGDVSARLLTSVSTSRRDRRTDLSFLFPESVTGVSFWDRLSKIPKILEIYDPSSPLVSSAPKSIRQEVNPFRYEKPDISGIGGGIGNGPAWVASRSGNPVPDLNMRALRHSNLGVPSRALTARLGHTQRMRTVRRVLPQSLSTSALPPDRGDSSRGLQRAKSSAYLTVDTKS